jgi:hypothetical protein
MPGGTMPFKVYLTIIVLLSFWPMPALSHPAGDFYQQAIAAIQSKEHSNPCTPAGR